MTILRRGNRRGQSTGEYAVVIALVLGAVIGMQTFVRRALNGRFKDAADTQLPGADQQVLRAGGTADAPTKLETTGAFDDAQQFEPAYAHSATETTSQVRTKDLADVVAPISVKGSSGAVSTVQGKYESTTYRDSKSGEDGAP